VPKLLGSIDALGLYASGAHAVSDWAPPRVLSGPLLRQWSHYVLRKAMAKATVLVAPVHELDAFGPEELAGKTVVTTTVNDDRLAQFRDKGVHLWSTARRWSKATPWIRRCSTRWSWPPPQGERRAAGGRLPGDHGHAGLEPRLLYPNGFKRVNRFAFVIHPLSQEYFKIIKPVEILSRVSPPLLMDSIEKVMAYAPPFVYSRIEGIKSPTGAEAEGWLISVGGTPKENHEPQPEFTYRRLLAAAEMAKKLGAQIMAWAPSPRWWATPA